MTEKSKEDNIIGVIPGGQSAKAGRRKGKEKARIIKFVLFSTSAGIIETASFTALELTTEWPYWPCYLIALVLSVLWNFTLNRKFTFKSANNVPKAMMQVLLFYCVFTPTTTLMGNYLAETLHWNEYMVLGLTMCLNISTEYLYDRFVVFRKTLDTNKLAQRQAAKEAAAAAKQDASTAAENAEIKETAAASEKQEEN